MNDITLTSQNALIERDADGVFYLSRELEVGAANWADDAPTPLATFDIRAAREILAQLTNAIKAHDRAALIEWHKKELEKRQTWNTK